MEEAARAETRQAAEEAVGRLDEAPAGATAAARSDDAAADRALDEINGNLKLLHTRLGELLDEFKNHAHQPIEVQAHLAEAEEAVEDAAEHTEAAADQTIDDTAKVEQVAAPQVTVPPAPAQKQRRGLYRHAGKRG